MIIASFTSLGSFAPIGSSIPVGLWAPVNVSASIDLLVSVDLILSPYIGLLVVQDMTQPFVIRKTIIVADNTAAQMYTKDII